MAAKVVDLPELDANAMYKLDSGGASYWAAAHVTEGETALKPLERASEHLDAFAHAAQAIPFRSRKPQPIIGNYQATGAVLLLHPQAANPQAAGNEARGQAGLESMKHGCDPIL